MYFLDQVDISKGNRNYSSLTLVLSVCELFPWGHYYIRVFASPSQLNGRDENAGHPVLLQDKEIPLGARETLTRTPVNLREVLNSIPQKPNIESY